MRGPRPRSSEGWRHAGALSSRGRHRFGDSSLRRRRLLSQGREGCERGGASALERPERSGRPRYSSLRGPRRVGVRNPTSGRPIITLGTHYPTSPDFSPLRGREKVLKFCHCRTDRYGCLVRRVGWEHDTIPCSRCGTLHLSRGLARRRGGAGDDHATGKLCPQLIPERQCPPTVRPMPCLSDTPHLRPRQARAGTSPGVCRDSFRLVRTGYGRMKPGASSRSPGERPGPRFSILLARFGSRRARGHRSRTSPTAP